MNPKIVADNTAGKSPLRDLILSKIDSVPAMPASASQVFRIVRDPGFEISLLVKAIEFDQNLTVNVLRLANSAYFGFSRTIGSIRDAVVRLGTDNILNLVVALNVAPIAKIPIKGYDLQPGALWKHSIIVAVGTEEISKALRLRMPDFIFTAGLLHDIGKIVLSTFLEVDVAPVMKLAFEGRMSFELAEQQVLGIDHAEVGAALLDKWRLPVGIVNAVRWHHDPSQAGEDPRITDIVHVANVLSIMQGIGRGSDGLNYSSSREAANRLGIDIHMSEKIISNVLARMDEIREWFPQDDWR